MKKIILTIFCFLFLSTTIVFSKNMDSKNYSISADNAFMITLSALNKLNFRGDRVFNAIVKSLRDESAQVRINAIEVLMNSDDDRAVDLIKSMLDDPNKEVVQNAVIALYNLLGDEILEEIINVQSYSDNARAEAIKLQEDLRVDEDFVDEE